MNGLTDAQKERIVELLTNQLEVNTVILFGSAAKGKLRPDSDIDLAIITDQTYNPYELFMTAQQLADILKREVDLLDFKQASTVFQAQIVGNGVLLFDGKPIDRQYLFMRALKDYALLNEERRDILRRLDYAVKGDNQLDEGHHPEQNGDNPTMHRQNS